MGRWEDTLVIFTSDHGDYLGDHWLGEKELFHDCIQRVPLLVAAPGGVPGQVEHRFAEAIDLAPTILDALGLPGAPHVLEGRSLLPILRGEAVADWREAVFSELDWTFRGARRRLGLPTGQHRAFMVREAGWKYVHWTSGLPPQLFDLSQDPTSSTTWAATRPMRPRGHACGRSCGNGPRA
jgi:arylsulfatase A-like enzyme